LKNNKLNLPGRLNFEYRLIDMQGRMLLSGKNENFLSIGSINIGTYILELKDLNNGQKIYKKIIVF